MKEFDKAEDKFDKVYEKCWKEVKKNPPTAEDDMDFETLFAKYGWKKATSDIDKLIEWDVIDNEYADNPANLSVHHNMVEDSDLDFGEEEFFVQDPRGFSCILDEMIKDIKEYGADFELGQEVTDINYEPGYVNV